MVKNPKVVLWSRLEGGKANDIPSRQLKFKTNPGDVRDTSEVYLRYFEGSAVVLAPITSGSLTLPWGEEGQIVCTYLDATSSIPRQYWSG